MYNSTPCTMYINCIFYYRKKFQAQWEAHHSQKIPGTFMQAIYSSLILGKLPRSMFPALRFIFFFGASLHIYLVFCQAETYFSEENTKANNLWLRGKYWKYPPQSSVHLKMFLLFARSGLSKIRKSKGHLYQNIFA